MFARVIETMTGRGFVGDERHVELLYALCTSRLLPRPMCAFVKAPSRDRRPDLANDPLKQATKSWAACSPRPKNDLGAGPSRSSEEAEA